MKSIHFDYFFISLYLFLPTPNGVCVYKALDKSIIAASLLKGFLTPFPRQKSGEEAKQIQKERFTENKVERKEKGRGLMHQGGLD